MDVMLIKPWPPVKPMDPQWLIEFGMQVESLSDEQVEKINLAFNNYYNACLEISKRLESDLDAAAGIKFSSNH